MMSEILNHTVNFFAAPRNTFWRWADTVDVIEWHNGSTITYRDELIAILSGMNEGMPPLGAILLTLAACHDNWKNSTDGSGVLHGLLRTLKEDDHSPGNEYLEYYIHEAVKFMDLINSLPAELRTGSKKIHLLREVYEGSNRSVTADQARSIVEEFTSGRTDALIQTHTTAYDRDRFKQELQFLQQALERFPYVQKLELRLRTGLEKIPGPAPLQELPEIDLLDQLRDDPKTTGIARLTQHLIAALNIQMHSHGTSDQPFGGISDITNRGNLDRLLLSELAQDELLMTARLVNNEALYLRREEPPDQITRQRTILLDTTIRMWGLPRIFGISAALAYCYKIKSDESISSFALDSKHFSEIELATKHGVIDTLERLNAGMHCGEALTSFMDADSAEQGDYMLITSSEAVQLTEFQQAVAALKKPINYLITVNRNGEFHFYEYNHGKRKLLIHARLHLEELLFPAASPSIAKNLPAFLKTEPTPLLFPSAAMKVHLGHACHIKNTGVIGITSSLRLLFWPMRDKGAKELMTYMEPGNFYFGSDESNTLFILVHNWKTATLKLYSVDFKSEIVDRTDLQFAGSMIHEIVFYKNFFYLRLEDDIFQIDCFNAEISICRTVEDTSVFFQRHKFKALDIGFIKRHINNGYSVLQRIRNISVNKDGQLILDNHHIKLLDNGVLRVWDNPRHQPRGSHGVTTTELTNLTANPRVKFYKAVWADGSEATVDSRGFLHLRSSDSTLSEITITLIVGKPLAAWASDGTITGSTYFISQPGALHISAADFAGKYLKRFIETLQ